MYRLLAGKLLTSLSFVACLWLTLDAQFVSRVDVVDVYATVTDRSGRPIEGLTKEDFTIFEDERPQVLSVFAEGDMGLSAALALDRSFSMAGTPLAVMKAAARAFLSALPPRDRAMIIGVGSRVETIAPLSEDRAATQRALEAVDAWGTTSLYDAIVDALARIEPADGRRALVILSDGDDRGSQVRAEDALARARRSDVLIYPVSFGRKRPTPLFAQLAEATGGRTIHVKDVKHLQEQLSNVAGELRHQYLLGYSPARPFPKGRAEWRRLRVRVAREGVTVRSRPGFEAESR